VLGLARLAVAERSGAGREEIAGRLSQHFGELAAPTVFFDMPRLDISSSQIRRRVAQGEPIRYLVPDPVAEHIARGRLYR
jgi:nicotinate-nucleotide adenylyltransferase